MLTATPAPERAPSSSRLRRLRAAANRPVSAASTAAFRIAFGLLIAFSFVRFLANGWVGSLYLAPEHHLGYGGIGPIPPLPAPWMHLELVALALCGISIAIGFRVRLALLVFLVGFTHAELIDATLYLNHYWFMTLCGVLLLVLPVQHMWSLDARRGRIERCATVPSFVVWVLRAQVGVVYVFAGLAKLNSDWLFRAQPLQLWLSDRADTFLIGPVLGLAATAFAASWAAAFFDCTIVGWLLWSRSRPWAYGLLVAFHVATGALFQIGVFPLVMAISALIFFPPTWPHRFVPERSMSSSASPPPLGRVASLGLLALLAIQLFLPLRHYTYDSNVRWSEEGYYLAWRVMLTEKAGFAEYRVTDRSTGETWTVAPTLVLTDWQANQASTKPQMIRETAKLIANHYVDRDPADIGMTDLEIRADVFVTMNGRPATRLVDPDVDLLDTVPVGWILDEPAASS